MNFLNGRIADDDAARAALCTLNARILAAKEAGPPDGRAVLRACDAVANAINEREHLHLLVESGMPESRAKAALVEAKRMLSAAYLEERLRRELPPVGDEFIPFGRGRPVKQRLAPLGALFHIAAGNVDALPAMSVIEGLLTGNINILKLPSGDDGLSIQILEMLTDAAPALGNSIYAFGISSGDMSAMKTMADCADAIVVWGGDEAIAGVRRLAPPGVKLIEWGHRISFAYVSGEVPDAALAGVARNICDTNQLLCSSCQGIFLDTESFEEASAFAERFARILEEVSSAADDGIFMTARKTLEIYTEQLEAAPGQKRVYRMPHCSVIAERDARLTPSYMYRNCWVRPLPQSALLRTLSQNSGRLQTAALLCAGDRSALEAQLIRAGVSRVTSGEAMSEVYCGAPHDGEFSLARYVRVISVEGVR